MELLQMGDLGQEITWWYKSRINQSTGWWQEDPIKVCVNFIVATRLQTYWKSWLLSCLSFWPPLMPTFHRAEFKPQMSWVNHVLSHVLVSPTHTEPGSQCVNCTAGLRKSLETRIGFLPSLGYYSENCSFHGWNELISCQIERNVFSSCQQINLNAYGKSHRAHSVGIMFDQHCISSEGNINNIGSKIPIRYNLRYAQRWNLYHYRKSFRI